MARIAVPRWIMVALSGALGVSLLAVAFLLGRESRAPEATAATARRSQLVTPRHGIGRLTRLTPAADELGGTRAPQEQLPAPAPRQPAPAIPGLPEASPPPGASPRATATGGAVCEYFARLDQIPGASAAGASDEVAQNLLAAVLQGDNSGLDRLITDVGSAEQAVQAVQAPPECAEHHRHLVVLLGESKALLGRLVDTSLPPAAGYVGPALRAGARAERAPHGSSGSHAHASHP